MDKEFLFFPPFLFRSGLEVLVDGCTLDVSRSTNPRHE